MLFQGCELAISKLEPYLGKVLINPPPDALGSMEWVGLRRTTDLPLEIVAYLLMLPAFVRDTDASRQANVTPEWLQPSFLISGCSCPTWKILLGSNSKLLRDGRALLLIGKQRSLNAKRLIPSLMHTVIDSDWCDEV